MKKEEFEKDQDWEIEPYNYNKMAKIPSWVKILLLKYWAAGAAFYFAGVGSTFINVGTAAGGEGLLLWFTLILALIMDYVIRPIVRLFRTSNDNTFYYNMVNSKGVKSLFLNILYALFITVPIFYISGWLTQLSMEGKFKIWNIFGDFGWGLDPFLCGFMCLFFDFVYLFIKNTICNFYSRQKFVKNAKYIKDYEL